MIHLVQILREELPDMYEIDWIDCCRIAYAKNGIYDLDALTQIYPAKIYAHQDKISIVVWEQ